MENALTFIADSLMDTGLVVHAAVRIENPLAVPKAGSAAAR